MKLLVGFELGGPTFTDRDVDGKGRLGEPIWGPSELLRDLHLRLGLPVLDAPASVRVPRWASRIRALADGSAFYAKSFEADPLGTARTLLAWRDALVDAGWDGRAIPDASDRLAAIAAIEARAAADDDLPLPPGTGDRLVVIEAELRQTKHRIYDEIALVEHRALWSTRWRNVFALLEGLGTTITQTKPRLPGATPHTDLGVLQDLLRGADPERRAPLRGDGSLLVFRGETSAELAALTAGFLAKHGEGALVVRSLDVASLEAAIVRQGLGGQGHTGSSAARPAMQVLPLAIELAYEPRDPHRVLELLTLPVGPFRGKVGSKLARAVSRQPGIGGQEWIKQREYARKYLVESTAKRLESDGASKDDALAKAEAYAASRLERVTEWLETPAVRGHATRADLLALGKRVSTFLQGRLANEDTRSHYAGAYAQARAFTDALVNESRDTFTREEARHLLDTVVRADESQTLSIERAGRLPHVAHPGAILAPTRTVVLWNHVAAIAKKPTLLPWNADERAALAAAGVWFVEPGHLLRAEADAWRNAVLAATERLVLVIPGSVKGEPMSPHPLWDEIRARLDLKSPDVARITRDARTLLEQGDAALADLADLEPLDLPAYRDTWTAAPKLLARNADADADEAFSYTTAFEKLVSCPLSWVLSNRAALRSGALAKVADGSLLYGNLAHRLVEELFQEGAFSLSERAFTARASVALERLIEAEGATLLLEGASFERVQLAQQIARAMQELRRYLDDSGYRIAGVEEPIAIDSALGKITGRLDVRLEDDKGHPAVLDLKWGASKYRGLLEQGLAIQLAVYARALRKGSRGAFVPAGYFAINAARLLTADDRMRAPRTLEGDSLDATWDRAERTAQTVMKSLSRGKVPVARKNESLPAALGVKESALDQHYVPTEPDAACEYCPHAAVCGRAWEDVR